MVLNRNNCFTDTSIKSPGIKVIHVSSQEFKTTQVFKIIYTTPQVQYILNSIGQSLDYCLRQLTASFSLWYNLLESIILSNGIHVRKLYLFANTIFLIEYTLPINWPMSLQLIYDEISMHDTDWFKQKDVQFFYIY